MRANGHRGGVLLTRSPAGDHFRQHFHRCFRRCDLRRERARGGLHARRHAVAHRRRGRDRRRDQRQDHRWCWIHRRAGLGSGNTGTLSVSNGFSLNSTAHLPLDLTATAAGAGYDQVVVSGGAVTLGGDLTGSAITFSPANFTDVFYIILNTGAGTTTGTLGGIAEGGSIFIGPQEFQISYTSEFGGAGFVIGGAGNDVALLAVPEPGVAASLLGGLGLLLGLRRRRA